MDASCGPSNGVKTLQRHFESDRSLHQNEFRQTGNNGSFRTTPEQAQLQRAQQEQEQFLNAGRAAGPPLSFRETESSHANSWAQDFQHAAPRIAQVNHALAGGRQIIPQREQNQSPAIAGWGAEFMAMQNQAAYREPGMMNAPATLFQPSAAQFVGQPFMSYTPALQNHQGQHTRATEDQDAAFHEAFREAEASLQNVQLSQPVEQQQPLAGTVSELEALDGRQETMADMGDRLEADALADTAGELIHAMADERSDKFRQSAFMALMHKLRDREVVVEEGKMVDAATHTEIKSHQPGPLEAAPAAAVEQTDVPGDEASMRQGRHYHGTDFGDRT